MHYKKKDLKKFFAFTILYFSFTVSAQSGENVYPFMNIPVSARQAALGGDAISVRDNDVNFAGINPSLLNLDMDNMLSLNYAFYLADSKFGTIAYAKDLGRGNLLSINARYLDYGSMPRTDESGAISGDFSAMDASVGVGYALQFEDDWTIGANVNLITSKIDNYTSMAVAANLGVAYHLEENKETVSLLVRNFGDQIKTYNGEKEKMPFRIDLGYTRILDNFPVALTITAHDLQKFNISQDYNNNGQEVKFPRKVFDHLSFGAELFPEQSFNIRLGYNVKRGNELAILQQRSFAGLSFGFGFKISSFKFDFAHVRYANASNVNQIGITMDLIELGGNRR